MTTLDDFFQKPKDTIEHPRVRLWRSRLASPGTTATLELFSPPSDFGWGEVEMNLQFHVNNQPDSLETFPWNDDLNSGLIDLKVRAVNLGQEAERFALGLRAAMSRAEREYGDGYFNGVLLDLMKDSDLSGYSEIKEILDYAYAAAPYREGKSSKKYENCREMITDAISGRARELTDNLRYKENEAKEILVAALARYMDVRFTVSSRRRFGLL